jgi:predicted nucleic acid-binding protein
VSGNRYLLDTNILLYLIGKKIPVDALPEGEFSVSFVTELEVLSYPSITPQEEHQLKRLLHDIPVIDITAEIKERTIDLRKKYNLRLPDAIIAATALHLDATLVTNDKGFSLVQEIQSRSIGL